MARPAASWLTQARAGAADHFPEFAQPRHPVLPGVAGDDRAVDGADRNAGQPGRLDALFQQAFVDTRLVGAQRAAALQHQGNAVELRRIEAGGRAADVVRRGGFPPIHVPAPAR
jgi:hypothetical protein